MDTLRSASYPAATNWELAASEIATMPEDDNRRTTIMLNMTSSPADSQTGPSIVVVPHEGPLAGPRLSSAMTRTDHRTGEDYVCQSASCSPGERSLERSRVHDGLATTMYS